MQTYALAAGDLIVIALIVLSVAYFSWKQFFR